MTTPWIAEEATGRASGDHVCWPFRGTEEFTSAALPFLAEGLARGERAVYVHGGDDTALSRAAAYPGLGRHLETGALLVTPSTALPGPAPGADLDAVVHDFASIVRAAESSGFTGLRMFSDVTSRVRDPARLGSYLEYEHRIDRLCLDVPFTVACAYDRDALGDEGVARLAAVHALAPEGAAPFRLRASRAADAALVGEVDAGAAPLLATVVNDAGLRGATVDATGATVSDEALRVLSEAGVALVLAS